MEFPNSDETCTGNGENEVVLGRNDIKVSGGSRDRTHTSFKQLGDITEAYVIETSEETFMKDYDIGMAITTKSKPFSNKADFEGPAEKVRKNLYKASVIPICIAARTEDTALDTKDLKLVGWGPRYTETPTPIPPNTRSPLYSSCVTNEIGKNEWKFKACDMQELQKTRWLCERAPKYPSNYPYNKCKGYFIKAEECVKKSLDPVLNKKALDKADKIIVTDSKGNDEECYKETHFKDMGWCKVQGLQSKEPGAWGFCSPSCKESIIGVG